MYSTLYVNAVFCKLLSYAKRYQTSLIPTSNWLILRGLIPKQFNSTELRLVLMSSCFKYSNINNEAIFQACSPW